MPQKGPFEQLVIEASRIALKGERATAEDRSNLGRLWARATRDLYDDWDRRAFLHAVAAYLEDPANVLLRELLDVATRVQRWRLAQRNRPDSAEAQANYWWQRGAMA